MEKLKQNRILNIWPCLQAKWQSDLVYLKVEEADAETQENLLQHEMEYKRKTATKDRIVWGCILFLKALFVFSYILLVYDFLAQMRSKGQDSCVLGNERIFDDVPVIYESVRFERAGFHDPRHSATTVFEGAPKKENEAAWRHILKMGVVSISEHENSKILNGSASTRGDRKQHIVELEMFHQLHCLNWLRIQFWELNSVATTSHTLVDFPQRENHTDHCIDYLRQVIMCHGDITPITFEWIPEIEGYIAHHTTEHKCRNFQAIYDWAESRDTTGISSGGKHMNVELEQPENYD